MAFPATLTNAEAGVTEIIADHLNNLEAKVGIDGSAVVTSLDYLIKNTGVIDPGHRHSKLFNTTGLLPAIEVAADGEVSVNYPMFVSTPLTDGADIAGWFDPSIGLGEKIVIGFGAAQTGSNGFAFGYTHHSTHASRKLFIGTREGWDAGGALEGITITGAGFVGIGGYGLRMFSVIQPIDSVTYGIGINNAAATGVTCLWTDATGYARLDGDPDGSNGILLNGAGTGYVGIGTLDPQAKLELKDGSFYLSDSDVTHGITAVVPTNVFGALEPLISTGGGLNVYGLSESASVSGLQLTGIIGSADPIDTVPAIMIKGRKQNGTGIQALGDAETVAQILNNASALVTILGNGNVGIGDISPGSKLAVADLPTYADNAAAKAGGLTDNDFYRTSTGVLMVVYT